MDDFDYEEAKRIRLREPICNHTERITNVNRGYCKGRMPNRIAFESEIWLEGEEKHISFVMPEFVLDAYEKEIPPEEDTSPAVLTIGMRRRNYKPREEAYGFYLEYLQLYGMLKRVRPQEQLRMSFWADEQDTPLVRLDFLLSRGKTVFATTDLLFRQFEEKNRTATENNEKIIPFHR